MIFFKICIIIIKVVIDTQKSKFMCKKDDRKMEKVRGFEIAKGWEDKGINMPVRKTD